MDILKSKLTAASRASNVAIWMLSVMYGLSNGKIYNWGRALSSRVTEAMLLKHKTLYVPHHIIALFLEALRTQVALENRGGFVASSRVEPYKPAMYYWLHLDTFTVVATETTPRKKARQELAGSMEDGGEEDNNSDEEVETREEETYISSSSKEDEGEFCMEQSHTKHGPEDDKEDRTGPLEPMGMEQEEGHIGGLRQVETECRMGGIPVVPGWGARKKVLFKPAQIPPRHIWYLGSQEPHPS